MISQVVVDEDVGGEGDGRVGYMETADGCGVYHCVVGDVERWNAGAGDESVYEMISVKMDESCCRRRMSVAPVSGLNVTRSGRFTMNTHA